MLAPPSSITLSVNLLSSSVPLFYMYWCTRKQQQPGGQKPEQPISARLVTMSHISVGMGHSGLYDTQECSLSPFIHQTTSVSPHMCYIGGPTSVP